MEHLLNLLWFAVASGLFAAVLHCHRRNLLRCSLPVALFATAVLAIFLFPALSATDDLQRAKLDTETTCRHLVDSFLLGSTPDMAVAVMCHFLLLLMLLGACFLTAEFLARLADCLDTSRFAALRPVTPRPPPALLIATI